MRRTVAEEFRQHMDVAREERGLGRIAEARDGAPFEKIEEAFAGGLRRRFGPLMRGM